MKILHLACLNNDPEIQPNMDPKCNPVGGEPRMFLPTQLSRMLQCTYEAALLAMSNYKQNIFQYNISFFHLHLQNFKINTICKQQT